MDTISRAMRQIGWTWSVLTEEQPRKKYSSSHLSSAHAPIPEEAAHHAANASRPVPTIKRYGFGTRRSTNASASEWHSMTDVASGGAGARSDEASHIDEDGSFAWTFWTTRYGITSMIMAVLINRIQHICRPRGRAMPLLGWKRWFVRLPAVLALLACTTLLAMRTIQTWAADHVPGESTFADFVAAKSNVRYTDERRLKDETLLWQTYLSTCIAVATDSLTRTIEGSRDPASPFNLMSFALGASAYHHEPHWVKFHYFLFILLEVAELLALFLMKTFRPPRIRRLHITTAFGLIGTLHYVLAPLDRRPLIFGFNRIADLAMMGVILLTIALHSLTMLLTEGTIHTSRLLFSISNLPSSSDDYSLALFKLGTACLQSTRLAGLAREVVTIDIPDKTLVEIDDKAGVRVKRGLEDILSGSKPRGLNNEIRLTRPNSLHRFDRYEAVFLPSTAKWNELKRFTRAFVAIVVSLWRAIYSRLPTLPLPQWVKKLPRYICLLWHGVNGERRREERIATRNRERERNNQSSANVRNALSRVGEIQTQHGETHLDAVWRIINDNETDMARQDSAAAAARAIPDDESDDDHEWSVDDDNEDGEEDDGRSSRSRSGSVTPTRFNSRSRSVSVLSIFDEEQSDLDDMADESIALVRAARRDYDEHTPGPDGVELSGDRFHQVLLAHIASGGDRPLTRSQFRALARQSPATASLRHEPAFIFGAEATGSSSGISTSSLTKLATDSESDAHLKDVILRRRREALRLTEGGEDEDKLANRDRMRTCVVCCYEERTIICWPCRCLAMCDGCREELASRPGSGPGTGGGSASALHDCPTCRTKVEGFSRIYMP